MISRGPFECELFMNAIDDIAADFRMPTPASHDDIRAVFQAFCQVPCADEVGPNIKPSKWFSIMNAMQWREPQWTCLKVLLEHYRLYVAGIESEALYDVDKLVADLASSAKPKEVMAHLRARDENSLAQSVHFMTETNRQAQRMLLVVGGPLWATHAARAKHKLTPADNMRWRFHEVTQWQAELTRTMEAALCDPAKLMFMMVLLRADDNDATPVNEKLDEQQRHTYRIFDFFSHLVALRVWQLMIRALAPMSSLAGLLFDDGQRSSRLEQHEASWRWLLEAEQRATQSAEWKNLVETMYWAQWPTMRIPYMLLDRHRFQYIGEAASWINDMEDGFGDSKLIEDLNHHAHHQHSHHSKGGCVNSRASRHAKLRNSGVLAARLGSHGREVSLDEEDFQCPPTSTVAAYKESFRARQGQLPKEWSTVFLKPGRLWRSPGHAAERAALAAWCWMREYNAKNLGAVGVGIGAAWQSGLAEHGMLLRSKARCLVFFTFGSAVYGVPTWSMLDTPCGYKFDSASSSIGLSFITNAAEWDVLEYEVQSPLRSRIELGLIAPYIALATKTAPTETLLQHAIRKGQCSSMSKRKLGELLACLAQVPLPKASQRNMLEQLVRAAFPASDESFIQALLTTKQKEVPTQDDKLMNKLAEDPDFRAAANCLAEVDMGLCKDFDHMIKVRKRREAMPPRQPRGSTRAAPKGKSAATGGRVKRQRVMDEHLHDTRVRSSSDTATASSTASSTCSRGEHSSDALVALVEDPRSPPRGRASSTSSSASGGSSSSSSTSGTSPRKNSGLATPSDDAGSSTEHASNQVDELTSAPRTYLPKQDLDDELLVTAQIATWLAELLPDNHVTLGITLVQDTRENRFKATFPHAEDVAFGLVGEFAQKQCSRSYQKIRSHKQALGLVLDFIWGKYSLIYGDPRPAEMHIDTICSSAMFELCSSIPLNTTYREELAKHKASSST